MSRPAWRRLPGLLVTLFWVVMTSLLLIRHYGPGTTPPARPSGDLPAAVFGEHWFGVYQKDIRIGYSNWNFRRLEKGYAVQDTLKLRLLVMDAARDIEVMTNASLGPDLALESFDLKLRADLDMGVSGTVEGSELRLVITSSGMRTEKSIRLKDRPVLDLSMPASVMKAGLKPGSRHQMTVFDPLSLSLRPMALVVEKGGQMQAMGGVHETVKLRGALGGGEVTIWLTEQGEVLKQESPLGFTLVRETKEKALQTQTPSVDMAEAAAVPFDVVLPEGLSFLRIRISGIDLRGLDIEGGRQTLRGDVLEIRREQLGGTARRVAGGVSPDYLEDGVFIQSKNPGIVSLSADITRGEKDPLRMSGRINDWVYRNIEKTPVISVPLSPAVLKAARGDCNEHAVLFASLARAAGIPTRLALGLVHQEGKFYYHAWDEIYAGRWIAVDPTLGQFPADAAHIRLLSGDLDKQTAIAEVLGKIRLERLTYQ